MIGQLSVAVFAGVIQPAALHLDGDNIGGAVKVLAPSLCIDIDAADLRDEVNHRDKLDLSPMSAVLHRIRQFVGLDQQSGFPESSGVCDRWRPGFACGWDCQDGRRA